MAGVSVSYSVEGVEQVVARLNEELASIDNKTIAGLLAAGLIIQRDAQDHVPVEHGFLRASAYTRKTPEDPHVVEVGFSSEYALWVHENVEVHAGEPRRSGLGVLWGPHGEPKFLENAVTRKTPQVVETVKSYAGGGGESGE